MKVEFYNPEFPEGMEFEVGGVLLVNGGEAVEIDEAEERRFFANHGEELKDVFLRNQFMKVGGKKGQVVYLEDTEEVVEPDVVNPTTDDSPEKEGE